MNNIPNVVTDFSAVGDGVADDTAAMAAAHATGVAVAYPPGRYRHKPFTFEKGGIVGLGGHQDVWLSLDDTTTSDGITMRGEKAGVFRNFSMTAPANKPSGASLVIDAPSGKENWFSTFDNLYLETVPSGIKFERASHFSMLACRVNEFRGDAVSIDNKTTSDSGDSSITNCTFISSTGGETRAIKQYASGGLKVTATKMLGCAYGYDFAVNAQATSIILFSGCSIETKTAGAVFRRTAGAGSLAWLSFSGCEIVSEQYGIVCDASLPVTGFALTGSHFMSPNGGPGKMRVYLGQVNGFNIAGNVFVGSGVGDTGIVSTNLCSNGRIYGLGAMTGFTTPVSLAGTNVSAS